MECAVDIYEGAADASLPLKKSSNLKLLTYATDSGNFDLECAVIILFFSRYRKNFRIKGPGDNDNPTIPTLYLQKKNNKKVGRIVYPENPA